MSIDHIINTDNIDLAKSIYITNPEAFDNKNLGINILSWLITARPSILQLPHHPLTVKAFELLLNNKYNFNLAPDYLDALIWLYNEYEEPVHLDLIGMLLYEGYNVNWNTVDRFNSEIDMLLQYYDPNSEYNAYR